MEKSVKVVLKEGSYECEFKGNWSGRDVEKVMSVIRHDYSIYQRQRVRELKAEAQAVKGKEVEVEEVVAGQKASTK